MKKSIIIAAMAAIALSGCKKFLDQSVSPNLPVVTTIPEALTGAEKALADVPNGVSPSAGGSYTYYGYWIGYWAVSSGFIVQPDLSEYVTTTTEFQVWTDLYLNLSNINNLQNLSTAASSPNYTAIAMIMKAYDFEELVDNYNDVPYTQAFNSSILFPAYDKGAAVYASCITQLDAAIALIGNSSNAVTPGADDIIYAGNMASWAAFANTLKLRLIIHQSNLANFGTISQDMSATIATGFITGPTAANATAGYLLNDAYGGQESPFWKSYGTNQNGSPENILVKANTFSINMLHGFNDPRLPLLYTPVLNADSVIVEKGLYLGDPALSNDTDGAGYVSGIGAGLLQSASQPAVVFSAAESYFLQAEAALDGVIPGGVGSAQTYYQEGITASFVALNAVYPVPNSNPTTYYTPAQSAQIYYSQNIQNVGWTASATNYQQAIIYQKYIALNGYGVFEAYNEYRRTGYPNVPRSLDPAAIGSGIPRRIYYPQIEYDTNGANVGAEGTIDPFGSTIFWDTSSSH